LDIVSGVPVATVSITATVVVIIAFLGALVPIGLTFVRLRRARGSGEFRMRIGDEEVALRADTLVDAERLVEQLVRIAEQVERRPPPSDEAPHGNGSAPEPSPPASPASPKESPGLARRFGRSQEPAEEDEASAAKRQGRFARSKNMPKATESGLADGRKDPQ
jgi:hypothetical protein